MSFEKIGPYKLTGKDSVLVSLALSFKYGSFKGKLFCYGLICFFLLLALAVLIILNDLVLCALLLGGVAYIYVGVPFLRAQSQPEVFFDFDEDGLVCEHKSSRTTYFWDTCRRAHILKDHFIVMVTPDCALIIPKRVTSPENLSRLMALLESKQIAGV